MRAMSMALGRTPPAADNEPDLSKHFVFGTKKGLGRQDAAVEGNLGWRDSM